MLEYQKSYKVVNIFYPMVNRSVVALTAVVLALTSGCATIPRISGEPVGASAFSVVQEENTRLMEVSNYQRLIQLRLNGYDLKGEEPEGNVLYFAF